MSFLMSLKQYWLILFTVILLSIGQILFKVASTKIDIANKGIWAGFLFQTNFLIALSVYGIATLLWLAVLKMMQLRVAYPFVALAFVFVPLLAYFFLGEPLKITTFIGAAVIMIGVYISLCQ